MTLRHPYAKIEMLCTSHCPTSEVHNILCTHLKQIVHLDWDWPDLFFFNFLKFIYFSWRLITLQYCSGFCHTLIWISHGCTCVPHPEPSSHLPPHPIPLGDPSAPALSTLSHASNLDWWSVSHMIIYMFQCYSVRSSHPHLLPQSPKDCLYICVSFSVSHIGLSLPSFKFNIYTLLYCIGVFLSGLLHSV